VSSGPPGVEISLHDVELRAAVSTNVGGIAVLEGVAGIRRVRHHDHVQCSEAATLAIAQINVELDGASKKVWFEVGVRIYTGLCRQVHAIVVVKTDLIAAVDVSLGPILRVLDVQCRVDSVNFHREGRELSARRRIGLGRRIW